MNKKCFDALREIYKKGHFMDNIKNNAPSRISKSAISIAERLIDIYAYHHKFQTKEFIDYCNKPWSDE